MQGYITLNTLIRSLCVKRGDPMAHSFSSLLPLAAEGLADLGSKMNIGSNVRTVSLKRDAVTKRINLPDDYVDYVKVGFRYNGNFIGLGHNPLIAPLESDNCGNYQPVSGGNSKGLPADYDGNGQLDLDGIPYGLPIWAGGTWRNGNMINRPISFGHAGGWSESGYFNINLETRTIDFSSDTQLDDVLFKYITSGFKIDASNDVLVACRKAIELYIIYAEKFYAASTLSEHAIADGLHRKYLTEVLNAADTVHGSSNAEIGDAYRQTAGRTVRE